MRAPDWLTARPVAHRGLHDIARGIVENMPAAAEAAITGNFAIECDIQLTSDGEAMVHHDDELGRLTEGSGALLDEDRRGVEGRPLQEHRGADDDARRPLQPRRRPRAAGDRGEEPFRRRPQTRETDGRGAVVLQGPAVGMSFDPDQVVALREIIPSRPHGIVAEHDYTAAGLAGGLARAASRDDASAPLLPYAAGFRRLLGQRTAVRSHPGLRAMCSAARC